MLAKRSDNETISGWLKLAGVPTTDSKARGWIESALAASRALAAHEPRPTPAKHNAPLNAIARATDQLIAALDDLRRHGHSHGAFWRCEAFGPLRGPNLETPAVISTLENIRHAACKARMTQTGRPRDYRKQHIVNLALAFWARFSPYKPSSDGKNNFVDFASLFYEQATGLSVERKSHGIDRQIKAALRRLPIESQRATSQRESSSK
ncbi:MULTISPECIES: hypothetical protein [unclassified Bradyrhizobium]|uniref:hypothetical protein n=1 Tax=unclassified Bradyrhizobium TaxID=2631580 RepID=UPI003394C0F9